MIPAANYPHPSCAETDLVDGLRGLHLHLAGRRVDALGDLRLDRDQQLTSATFQEVIIWFHFKF